MSPKRLNPNDRKYVGCYYWVDKKGNTTYFVKVNGKMHKVPGINLTPTAVYEYRTAIYNRDGIDRVLGKKKQSTLTMDQAWDMFLEWLKDDGKEWKTPLSRYTHHIKPHIGRMKLATLTPLDMERVKRKWRKTGLGNGSQKQLQLLITRIVNKMYKWREYDGPNPMDGVDKVRYNKKRKRFLTVEQSNDLLDEVKRTDQTLYYQVALGLHGMRLDEVMKLRPMDIDFNQGFVELENVKDAREKDRTRFIPITEDLKPILKEMLRVLPVALSQPFFKRFKYEQFTEIIDRFGYNDGIDPKDRAKRVSFHTLRHSYASQLLTSGANLKMVQTLLGHKTLAVTADIYSHVADDEAKKAATDLAKTRAEARVNRKPRVIEGGKDA